MENSIIMKKKGSKCVFKFKQNDREYIIFESVSINFKRISANLDIWLTVEHSITFLLLPTSLTVAQDSHLQRVTIPEATYVQFASWTS